MAKAALVFSWVAVSVGCGGRKDEPAENRGPNCLEARMTSIQPRWTQRAECTPDSAVCAKAWSEGDASSCFSLAVALQGVDRRSEAEGLFERACIAGLSVGCVNHAANLWAEEKSPQDLTCARAIFEKTCDANDSMRCAMVGRMMAEAAKTDTARKAARFYLERRCADLKGPPCRMLAYFLEVGDLGTFDPSTLKPLMTSACEGGDPLACGDYKRVSDTFH